MTSRQAVVLASRVLCVFLLCEAFRIVANLPLMLFDVWRDWHMMQHMVDYPVFRVSALILETALLQLAVEVVFAIAFYQCGPRIAAFLTGETMASDSARVDPA